MMLRTSTPPTTTVHTAAEGIFNALGSPDDNAWIKGVEIWAADRTRRIQMPKVQTFSLSTMLICSTLRMAPFSVTSAFLEI